MSSEETSNPESAKKTKAKGGAKAAKAGKDAPEVKAEGEDKPKRPKVEVTQPKNPESGRSEERRGGKECA